MILERLSKDGSVAVPDLSREFGVSTATVRRDLTYLEHQRLLTRTHGGAAAHSVTYELPLRYKSVQHADEKRRIARAAAELVSGGMAVGLTGGTTATEVGRALAGHRNIRIVTNALNIAAELGVRPDIKIIVTGGMVRPESFELSGPLAEASLHGLTPDIAFIGVDGIHATAGCTTHQEVEAHTNRTMIQNSHRTVVVADSSKIGRIAFARICGIDAVDDLITGDTASAESVAALTDAGVRVTLV